MESGNNPRAMTRHIMCVLILAAIGFVELLGCATPAVVREYPNQQAMTGKTKSRVLACAGAPLKELHDQEFTLLRYYREAPMLEESPLSGKGSFPTVRHGCWATVVIENEKVAEVHYRFVPSTYDASDECETIFEPCIP